MKKVKHNLLRILMIVVISLLFTTTALASSCTISVKISDPDEKYTLEGISVGAIKISEQIGNENILAHGFENSNVTIEKISEFPAEAASSLFEYMVVNGLESTVLKTDKDGICRFNVEEGMYLVYCIKDQVILFSPYVLTLSERNSNVISAPKTDYPPRPQNHISIKVTKLWDDEMNKDGCRPESVTVSLLRDGKPYKKAVLSKANSWKHVFTNLSKKYSYTIKEEEVESYTPSYSGNEEQGFTIINKYTKKPTQPETPVEPDKETADVTVRKIWNDNDNENGKRPKSITVQLISGTDVVATATLGETSGWVYTFTELDKNKSYTVKEILPEGYSAEYLGNSTNGFTITNTPDKTSDPGVIPPPSKPDDPVKTDVFVKVIWLDDNDSFGKRPSSVTVHLISDGSICQSGVIEPLTEWEHTFGNVEINKAYTVLSSAVEGYVTTYSGNARDGFTITNEYSETTDPGTPLDPTFPSDPSVDHPQDPSDPLEPEIPQTGHKTTLLYILMALGVAFVVTGLILSLKRKSAILLILLGFIPVIISTVTFLAYDKESAVAGQNAAILLNDVKASLPPPTLVNDVVMNDSTSGALPQEEHLGYSVGGIIKIDSIGIELPVQSEWDYDLLKVSPCRYSGSVQDGNLILLGHNYKRHFGNIKKCRIGDSVTFTDINGRIYEYTVSSLSTLDPKALDELTATDSELTIFTCTESGEKRYVLRCSAIK